MFIVRLLSLLVLATSVEASDSALPTTPLTSEISAATKQRLPSCGIATTQSEAHAVIECIKAAMQQTKPFTAEIRIEGIDSIVWQAAIQLPSGQRLLLQHDDFGHGRITHQQCKDFLFSGALIPIQCGR